MLGPRAAAVRRWRRVGSRTTSGPVRVHTVEQVDSEASDRLRVAVEDVQRRVAATPLDIGEEGHGQSGLAGDVRQRHPGGQPSAAKVGAEQQPAGGRAVILRCTRRHASEPTDPGARVGRPAARRAAARQAGPFQGAGRRGLGGACAPGSRVAKDQRNPGSSSGMRSSRRPIRPPPTPQRPAVTDTLLRSTFAGGQEALMASIQAAGRRRRSAALEPGRRCRSLGACPAEGRRRAPRPTDEAPSAASTEEPAAGPRPDSEPRGSAAGTARSRPPRRAHPRPETLRPGEGRR